MGSESDAADLGIPPVELAKLAYRGKLENITRGLYRLTRWIPDEAYPYAEAVARMGRGSYLYAESVIALLGLAPTNPSAMYVAVPKRTRRDMPIDWRVMRASESDEVVVYQGVPSQSVRRAIPAARLSMMEERLRTAAERARVHGYLTERELQGLCEEMGWA